MQLLSLDEAEEVKNQIEDKMSQDAESPSDDPNDYHNTIIQVIEDVPPIIK